MPNALARVSIALTIWISYSMIITSYEISITNVRLNISIFRFILVHFEEFLYLDEMHADIKWLWLKWSVRRIRSWVFNMKWNIRTSSLKSFDLTFIGRTKPMWILLRYSLNKFYAREVQDMNLRISRRTTILKKLYFTWLLLYLGFIEVHCSFTTRTWFFWSQDIQTAETT